MKIDHGFVPDEIVENDHYVFGGYGSLQVPIVNASRDWRSCVPSTKEIQNLNGIEPMACTNFGTLNAAQTLMKFLFGYEKNYSDRWFAKKSGTNVLVGNSPHVTAEFLRKNGDVLEIEWPFDASIKTAEDFYATPKKSLDVSAQKFIAEYGFGHDWITPPTAEKLWDALQYSPVGFSAHAWEKDENGFYFKPHGATDNHWVCLVYAEWGKYWLVVDSYMDHGELLKKVRWDALPVQAKRYTLVKNVVNENAFLQFLKALGIIINNMGNALAKTLMTPDVPVYPDDAPIPQEVSNSQKLYETARSFLNKDASPEDVASDEVGCVDSVTSVLAAHLGTFPKLTSTVDLYASLLKDKRFQSSVRLDVGNVVISVTGTGNGNLDHGHCGIVGENGTIMSNDSRDGIWRTNYSINSWIQKFRTQGGMKVRSFRLV